MAKDPKWRTALLLLVSVSTLILCIAAGPLGLFEVTQPRGLDFILQNSPTPQKYLIETMPGGVALLDYNNDGLLDIFLVNGGGSPARCSHQKISTAKTRAIGTGSIGKTKTVASPMSRSKLAWRMLETGITAWAWR